MPAQAKTDFQPGEFCWVDTMTTDAQRAKSFYTELFRWSAADTPAGDAGTYTMLSLDGKEIGGLSALPEPMRAAGVPPSWNSYVMVESADDAAAKAKKLGGSIQQEPFDVMDVGRMAVISDPTGATICVWQPRSHAGGGIAGVPNSTCWFELMTEDTAAATAFYTQLFGWKAVAQPMGDINYTMFMGAEGPNAGMMAPPAEMASIPPHWMVYFSVEDCEGTGARAESMGGKVVVPPSDVPGVGRFCQIQDPCGARFAVVQLAAE